MGLKDLLLQGPTSNNQSLEGQSGPQFAAYSNSEFAIGGEPGPPNAVDTIAENSLTQDYTYTHGNSTATAVASQLDLDGQPGPQFDTYRNQQFGNLTEPDPNVLDDTIAEIGLTQDYNYTHGGLSATANATLLGLGGNKGPQFADYRNKAYGNLTEPDPAGGPDNIVDTIAEMSLTQPYNYTHGLSSATAGGPNGSLLDKDGLTPTSYSQLGPPDGRY